MYSVVAWYFVSCPNKCPFWPLRVEILKRDSQNIDFWVCDHYALISYFLCKKTLTDHFSRMVGLIGRIGHFSVRCIFLWFFVSLRDIIDNIYQWLATNELHLYICCKATEQVLKSPHSKPWIFMFQPLFSRKYFV